LSITTNTAMWARTSINRAAGCCVCPNVCVQTAQICADATTTCMCYTDTCLIITIANRSGGKVFIAAGYSNSNTIFQNNFFTITDDGTQDEAQTVNTLNSGVWQLGSGLFRVGDLDGSIHTLRWKAAGGTATLRSGARIDSLEVGGT